MGFEKVSGPRIFKPRVTQVTTVLRRYSQKNISSTSVKETLMFFKDPCLTDLTSSGHEDTDALLNSPSFFFFREAIMVHHM